MADWPVIGGGQFATQLNPDAATSSVTNLTCSANDTKSAWLEIIAATEHDYVGINIMCLFPGTGLLSFFVDIGIGALGSEVVLYENFAFTNGAHFAYSSVFIPIRIPAGTRISVRGTTNSVSDRVLYVSIFGVPGDFLYQSYQHAETYGAVTATTEGTSVFATVAHTKGSYIEITSATRRKIKHLIIDILWSQTATTVNRDYLFDLAVGPLGSEQIVLADIYVRTTSTEQVFPSVLSLPIQIPVGSRISIRVQDTHGSGVTVTTQFVLHGLS